MNHTNTTSSTLSSPQSRDRDRSSSIAQALSSRIELIEETRLSLDSPRCHPANLRTFPKTAIPSRARHDKDPNSSAQTAPAGANSRIAFASDMQRSSSSTLVAARAKLRLLIANSTHLSGPLQIVRPHKRAVRSVLY